MDEVGAGAWTRISRREISVSASPQRQRRRKSGMDRVIASFHRSIVKMLGLLVVGTLLTGTSGLIAAGTIADRSDPTIKFVGYVGTAFFGVCTLVILAHAFRRGAVIDVSTAGIRYYRRSTDLIPWAAIAAMSVHVIRRQKFLVLELFPEDAARLKASRTARLLERGNEAFGFSGVWISMVGLDGSLDDLIDAIELARVGASGARHD
jgi:hypothetical protein